MEEKKVTTYKCLYMHSERRLYRAHFFEDFLDPWFEIVHDFSDRRLPMGMGGMVVDSRVYMVGGEKAGWYGEWDPENSVWDPEKILNSDSFDLNLLNGSLDRVRDDHFPNPSGRKTHPLVFILEKKIYLLSRAGFFCSPQEEGLARPFFEVFDPVERSWKNLPPPPSYTKDFIHGYFAGGHKLLTYRNHHIFDARKGEWEDGMNFVEDFSTKARALPSGTTVEFKGFLFATSCNFDALLAFQIGPDGLLKSHWVLHELDWVFRILPVDKYGRHLWEDCGNAFVTDISDGRMCLMFAESRHWHLHSVIFRVFIVDGADHPFSIHVESQSGFPLVQYDNDLIESVFMCDHRNVHEADASFMNLNPSGLDSSEGSKKHVVEFSESDGAFKKAKSYIA